jgi:hypothetical protein
MKIPPVLWGKSISETGASGKKIFAPKNDDGTDYQYMRMDFKVNSPITLRS